MIGSEFVSKVWWKLMLGTTIDVQWPIGKVLVEPEHHAWDLTLGTSKQYVDSADPNDHYRPWLEENVGVQKWDWEWDWKFDDFLGDRLTIKFRKGKEKYATIAILRWG